MRQPQPADAGFPPPSPASAPAVVVVPLVAPVEVSLDVPGLDVPALPELLAVTLPADEGPIEVTPVDDPPFVAAVVDDGVVEPPVVEVLECIDEELVTAADEELVVDVDDDELVVEWLDVVVTEVGVELLELLDARGVVKLQ